VANNWIKIFAILTLGIAAVVPAVSQNDEILTVGGNVTAPQVIRRVEATATEEARNAGISGSVQLECVVRQDGTVSVTRVAKGLGYGLDGNAQAALQQWRFSPATRDGVPVSVRAVIDVGFTTVVHVGADVTAPLEHPCDQPNYTDEARKAKITGDVQLEVIVHSNGAASVSKVEKGLGYGLDESAVAAVEKCTFEPATQNGHPVNVIAEVQLHFGLK
jgi:TonB family protein